MLNKLTSRVYYMDYVQNGDRPVLALIIGDNYSLVIDGGNSKEHCNEFLNYIKALNISKPKYLVLTHWHWDHVVGIDNIKRDSFTKGIAVIANERTEEKLSWMRGLKWTDEEIRKRVIAGEEIEFCEEHIKIEHPNSKREFNISSVDIVFNDELSINLGGITVELKRINTDHSEDCTLVNVKEEKIVFMGDAMYLDMYNGQWSYSRKKLYPLLDKLKNYGAKYYIPAHHPKYNNGEFNQFIENIKLLGDLVGEKTKLKDIVDEFERQFKKEPIDFELENIAAFIEGNLKK